METVDLTNLNFSDFMSSGEFLLYLSELDELRFSSVLQQLESVYEKEIDTAAAEFLEVLLSFRNVQDASFESRRVIVRLLTRCLDAVGVSDRHKARQISNRLRTLLALWR